MSASPESLADLPSEQQRTRSRSAHRLGTFIEFPPEGIAQSISDRFEEQARRYPARPAIRTPSRTLSYADLNQAANLVAHAILRQRQPADAGIGLLFGNEAAFVVASVGALKAGRNQVVLDSSVPRARLSFMLEQSECAVVVTNAANLSLARQLGPMPVLNVDELDGGLSSGNPGLRVKPDAIVSVAYTSGSTGSPKGIVWSHEGVLDAVRRHTNVFRVCPEDRLVTFRPSLRGYLYALLNGAAFYPASLRGNAALGVADWLIQEAVTVFRAPVSAFRAFASTLTADAFPHLRLIILFGEPVYGSDVELYRKHFSGGAVLASTLGCSEFDDYAYFFVDQASEIGKGVVPGGYLIGGTEVLLLGDGGRPVSGGGTGEIVIRSRYNAVGFWRRPDLTQAAFLPDPAGGDARLYRTGDVGRVGPDGCIFHLGRTDFQVKIRGHRADLAEVEAALRELDHVRDAVVVGREHTPGDTRLVAYVMTDGVPLPHVSELRRALVDTLPDHMVPSTYIVLETFPRTATGKIDRRALPAPDGARPAVGTPFVAPRTPIEERLAAMWAEVLRLDRVGVHDSFLELGGDSLLATLVISRVLEHLDGEASPRALFAAPTVAEMAKVIVYSLSGKLEESDLDRIFTDLDAQPGA